jgi:hypothetical protein
MTDKDCERFEAAIKTMLLVLRPQQVIKEKISGYWYGLRRKLDITELEQACHRACETLDWHPTPSQLYGLVSQRPYYSREPARGEPMPPEVRRQLDEILQRWEDEV